MPRRLGLLCACAALLGTACGGSSGAGGEGGRPVVVAAFYPLEFAAERVGGSAIEVKGLTPPGAEPHDLELTSGQVRDLAETDLVLYVGGGFQPALEDAVAGIDGSRKLDVLEGRELMPGEGEEDDSADPHVWLDPTRLAAIADEIAAHLSEVDPSNAVVFSDNAAGLREDLRELDDEFAEGLRDCRSNEIVTSHQAFGYLAARYGIDQVGISGIDPEAEPSAERLAEIAELVEERGVETIFFEELAPPDLAETLARETGAETEVLSPLETAPERGDYLDAMRANLERLREALDCA